MAPAILPTNVVAHRSQDSPGIFRMPNTKTPTRSLDGNAQSTAQEACRSSVSVESLIGEVDSAFAKPLCELHSTLKRQAKGNATGNDCDDPASERPEPWFIPVRKGMSDAELVWHGRNIEYIVKRSAQKHGSESADSSEPPRVLILKGGRTVPVPSGTGDCDPEAIISLLESSTESESGVPEFPQFSPNSNKANESSQNLSSSTDSSEAPPRDCWGGGHTRQPVPREAEDIQPTIVSLLESSSSSEVEEVHEFAWLTSILNNGNESVRNLSSNSADTSNHTPRVLCRNGGQPVLSETEDCEPPVILLLESSAESQVDGFHGLPLPLACNSSKTTTESSPPILRHNESENSAAANQQTAAGYFEQLQSTTTLSWLPPELANYEYNSKCCSNDPGCDVTVTCDGCSGPGTSSTCRVHGEVDSLRTSNVPERVETDSFRASNDFKEAAGWEKTEPKPSSKPNTFHFKSIAENLDISGRIVSREVVRTPVDQSAVSCIGQAADKVFVQDSLNALHRPASEGTTIVLSQANPAFEATIEKSLTNDERSEAKNPDSDIPTVEEEFVPALTSKKPPTRQYRKRKERGRKRGDGRKCAKRARVEFTEPLPGVTEYTSRIGWAGGKVVSTPEPGKEKEASAKPGKSPKDDLASGKSENSLCVSADLREVGGCISYQDMDGLQDETGACMIPDAPTDTSFDNHAFNSPNPLERNNNDIEFGDTEAVEALLSLKNQIWDKVAKTDAKLTEESEDKFEKVVEYSHSLDVESTADLSYLDPESAEDHLSDNISDVEYVVISESDRQIAKPDVAVYQKAEGVGAFRCREYEGPPDCISFVVNGNVNDGAKYQSLVRPEGFPGYPDMKMKCCICGELVRCFVDLEKHCVESHCESWEHEIKNAYLRALVPYLWEGFLEGRPEFKSKCPFCSQLFTCHSDFEGHMSELHSCNEPYLCPFCGERFRTDPSYSFHLGEHIRRNDYPSIRCPACSRCFSSQWELDLHAQDHESL